MESGSVPLSWYVPSELCVSQSRQTTGQAQSLKQTRLGVFTTIAPDHPHPHQQGLGIVAGHGGRVTAEQKVTAIVRMHSQESQPQENPGPSHTVAHTLHRHDGKRP